MGELEPAVVKHKGTCTVSAIPTDAWPLRHNPIPLKRRTRIQQVPHALIQIPLHHVRGIKPPLPEKLRATTIRLHLRIKPRQRIPRRQTTTTKTPRQRHSARLIPDLVAPRTRQTTPPLPQPQLPNSTNSPTTPQKPHHRTPKVESPPLSPSKPPHEQGKHPPPTTQLDQCASPPQKIAPQDPKGRVPTSTPEQNHPTNRENISSPKAENPLLRTSPPKFTR